MLTKDRKTLAGVKGQGCAVVASKIPDAKDRSRIQGLYTAKVIMRDVLPMKRAEVATEPVAVWC